MTFGGRISLGPLLEYSPLYALSNFAFSSGDRCWTCGGFARRSAKRFGTVASFADARFGTSACWGAGCSRLAASFAGALADRFETFDFGGETFLVLDFPAWPLRGFRLPSGGSGCGIGVALSSVALLAHNSGSFHRFSPG